MPVPRSYATGRHAGILVPLFSIASGTSWGIGEIADLPRLAAWLRAGGFDVVQLLPINEMSDGQKSPYSALSAMAIDPIFIAPGEVEEIAALGGEQALSDEDRGRLAAARDASSIQYDVVRALKTTMLRAAFHRFLSAEWDRRTPRAAELRAFVRDEGWWLDDYALYRALHAREQGRSWREWDPALRDRDHAALADARRELARDILFYQYVQWLAAVQWERARAACGDVGLFGDFPFMVSADSADVWARQDEFRFDASVGVPPDAFSATGQDWGFPAYRWPEIAAGGYQWLTARARRSAELYAGYRVDHLVGFYRTYAREADGSASFMPAHEPAQLRQGEQILNLFREPGTWIIAEDLGVVPDFVRESLARLGVPGYKVLRWEREWNVDGQPFRDPRGYPALSVATSGTHDTETLAEWWDSAPYDEKRAAAAIPMLRDAGCDPAAAFDDRIRDAILRALFAAGSSMLLLPIVDVFGWRDRINTPGRVSDDNWTWRLPWPVEGLLTEPEAQARARFLRGLAEEFRRL
jgi:4-alpha-glucanotransferase